MVKAYGLSSFFNLHGCVIVGNEDETKEFELITVPLKIRDYIMSIDSKYKIFNFRSLWNKVIDEFILKLIYTVAVHTKKSY